MQPRVPTWEKKASKHLAVKTCEGCGSGRNDLEQKEEMKATLNEMKKNLQGTNSEGEEVRIQINDLEQKKEKTIQKNKDTKETLGELQM